MKRLAPIYREAARRIAERESNQICYALAEAADDAGLRIRTAAWRTLNDHADFYLSVNGSYLAGWMFGMPSLNSKNNAEWPKDGRDHRVIALLTLAAIEESNG